MRVAVIGISGRVGSRVAAELLARGHSVTGIARTPDAVASRPGLTVVRANAEDAAALTPLLRGHDAIISASRFVTSNANVLLAAAKGADVKRLLVVGGAGSLEVAPGKLLMDTPEFPDAYKAEARAGGRFLNILRQEKDVDWTFLSPSADFAPGKRTGSFRLGKDQLLIDAEGRSWVSMEDYAIAMVDELERPRHSRARFTVGY